MEQVQYFDEYLYSIDLQSTLMNGQSRRAQSLKEENGIEGYLTLVEAGNEHSFIESLEASGLNNPLEKETLNKVVKAIKNYFEVSVKGQSIKKVA